jgi:hypothetical protein
MGWEQGGIKGYFRSAIKTNVNISADIFVIKIEMNALA